MSGDDAGNGGTAKTFTQAEVDAIVRDRLGRERAKFADYDELKTKAADADKQKTQLDRIEAQLAEQVKRTEKAERESLVRDVADELGVSVRMARKFEGKTRDEMLADGRETLRDMGIEPDKSKRKAKSTTDDDAGNGGDGSNGDGDDDGSTDDDAQGSSNGQQQDGDDAGRRAGPPRSRPRELRSGSSMSGGDREETDPMKLVEKIPRR